MKDDDVADLIMRLAIQRNAAQEALEDMAERYGATVEWDSEGLPALSMPDHEPVEGPVEGPTKADEAESLRMPWEGTWMLPPEFGVPAETLSFLRSHAGRHRWRKTCDLSPECVKDPDQSPMEAK